MWFCGARGLTIGTIGFLLSACGGGQAGSTGSTKPEKPTASTDPGMDTDMAAQAYTRVIEGTWTLAPGTENPNFCVKKTLTEDIYVHAIRPVHPPGTHHTLVTLGDADADCIASVAEGFVYAAGVGSEGITLPEGVALKLPAGETLHLGLHIYNTGTTELTGTSAMEILTMDAKDVKFESDSVLAGPVGFMLPPHQETTVKNDCQLSADQSVYALFPHMHQLGTHIKTTVTAGGVPNVLHDGPYLFNEQFQIPLDPILKLSAGDTITTECTYDNTSDKVVTFGESSDTEMCFSVLFRYPKQGSGICFSPPSGTANL
jgi:hypothetical protein